MRFDLAAWRTHRDIVDIGTDGLVSQGTPIAAVSSVTRGSQVFALGEDNRVWTTFFDPANLDPMAGGWSNWLPLGE